MKVWLTTIIYTDTEEVLSVESTEERAKRIAEKDNGSLLGWSWHKTSQSYYAEGLRRQIQYKVQEWTVNEDS